MKRKIVALLFLALFSAELSTGAPLPAFADTPTLETVAPTLEVDEILEEVEQTLVHYRAWLDKPIYTNVIKGTNHAARAGVMIVLYLRGQEDVDQAVQRVGVQGIRKVLLKQMLIHVELLSTSVPIGIVEYDTDVESAVEEQIELLEQTLIEFDRVYRRN